MRGAKDKRMGSPPHVRGKGCNLARGVRPNRITPACAGKRQRLGLCPLKGSGSPPHVRGKVSRIAIGKQTHRITPAYAGKRNDRHQQQAQEKDHPRVCGEKTALLRPPQTTTGSPPRMRGKVAVGAKKITWLGITPACAGKSLKRSRSTVPPVAIVPLFPSVCNKPVVSDGSPAGRDAPLFLPAENAVPASPAYNLRSL